MAETAGRTRVVVVFALLTALPILLAATGTVLGIWATTDPVLAPQLYFWAIGAAILLGLLLILKAIRDYRWGITLQQTRYSTLRELHDRIGPALDLMTEMALLEHSDKLGKQHVLRNIASNCCSALVAMTPEGKDVRAVVFELRSPDDITPLAHFGRNDAPRSFTRSSPAGTEIYEYLESGRNPRGELYLDTQKTAPDHYDGDFTRYRTFIRTPIRGNGAVFGMLTVDALKPRSLKDGDIRLAELIAAELSTAFAIAAAA